MSRGTKIQGKAIVVIFDEQNISRLDALVKRLQAAYIRSAVFFIYVGDQALKSEIPQLAVDTLFYPGKRDTAFTAFCQSW
jgi:L-2-hydroxyglutarate oxidase LhgO